MNNNDKYVEKINLLSHKKIYSPLLLFISILIFVISNPNILFTNGIGVLGFFIYLPVLLLIRRTSLKSVWSYGAIYGALSYGLYGYWLYNFHPLGLWIVCICYAVILSFVFVGLKLLSLCFKKNDWLLQFLFLCVYEYIKTLGFLGFSYGGVAYTLWRYTVIIQIVDIIGVFGLNLIVIFPSVWLSKSLRTEKWKELRYNKSIILSAFLWLMCVISIIFYGLVDIKKGNPKKYISVIAVQNNENPWKNGIDEYQKNVDCLMQLTDQALNENPDAKIVVWSETAIAPSILENYYGKEDFRRYELVYNLLRYLNKKNCVFVIGNSNQQTFSDGRIERYNSAFVFESGKNVIPPEPETYSKIKLVPFTEDFPYKEQFPRLYKKLLNGDFHLWDKGDEIKVFEKCGLKFSTPICFEDTFGSVCRPMIVNGARAFINLSNDAWSKSEVCQNQHLAMAVFRSVENRVPTVRSTASGQTCIINQHGKIVEMSEPFEKNYVVGKIPLYENDFKMSFYTKIGDVFGIVICGIFALILIINLIRYIINLSLRKKDAIYN